MGQGGQSRSLATALVHVWGYPGASYRAYLGTCTAPCVPGPIWGDMGPQEPPDPGLVSSNSRSGGDTVRHSQPRPGPARLFMGIAICGRPHSGHLRIVHIFKTKFCGATPNWYREACLGEPKGTLPQVVSRQAQPQARRRRVVFPAVLCIRRSWKVLVQS